MGSFGKKGKKGSSKGKGKKSNSKSKSDSSSTTPSQKNDLHDLAKSGNLQDFLAHPECRNPVLLQAGDGFRRTPLHLACYYGHLEIVKAIVGNGSDGGDSDQTVNTEEKQSDSGFCPQSSILEAQDGFLPAHFSAQQGHLECLKVLFKHASSKPGGVKKLLSRKVKGERGMLHLSSRKQHIKVVKYLIEKIIGIHKDIMMSKKSSDSGADSEGTGQSNLILSKLEVFQKFKTQCSTVVTESDFESNPLAEKDSQGRRAWDLLNDESKRELEKMFTNTVTTGADESDNVESINILIPEKRPNPDEPEVKPNGEANADAEVNPDNKIDNPNGNPLKKQCVDAQ